MTCTLTLSPFEWFALRTRTRFPFRYGIASLTEVPQLYVRTRVTVDGRTVWGIGAEGLPPKWFTKDPATSFAQDLGGMLDVIAHATSAAADIGREPVTFFELWRELDRQQRDWAASRGYPPLLSHLGVSLVERAVLDGVCRLAGAPLHRLVSSNALGIRLGDVYPQLAGAEPRDLLPAAPLDSVFVRHTVGLADALLPGDLQPGDRVEDGLPQDLETSIRAYGLRYFKVKLNGAIERDVPRLKTLLALLERETGGDFHLTVDGNESFQDFETFRAFWTAVTSTPELAALWPRTIAVEQPVHRNRALGDEAGRALNAWRDRPPLIVDESDGAVGDVPRALDLGYAGASHKNCKGIVKGIANACLLAAHRQRTGAGLLTGEDLCILGPVVLMQDLAMMALLGIPHVERNGHHYYRGLSMLPADWQRATLDAHGDLYTPHAEGFPRLAIAGGRINLASVNAAPFGAAPQFDPSVFPAVTPDLAAHADR